MELEDNVDMHLRSLIDWIEYDLMNRPEAYDEPRREEWESLVKHLQTIQAQAREER